ncbi:MAG: hypothetical protein J7493_15910 [Porphyrobacter sp.]|nr:hypothetical protein [Porphyrobacter sp.]
MALTPRRTAPHASASFDTNTPAGRALFQSLIPNPAEDCHEPEQGSLPFDQLCAAFVDGSPSPDLLLGLRGGRIVSAIPSDVIELDRGIWRCEGDDGDLTICFPKSTDAPSRQRLRDAWRTFLQAAG